MISSFVSGVTGLVGLAVGMGFLFPCAVIALGPVFSSSPSTSSGSEWVCTTVEVSMFTGLFALGAAPVLGAVGGLLVYASGHADFARREPSRAGPAFALVPTGAGAVLAASF